MPVENINYLPRNKKEKVKKVKVKKKDGKIHPASQIVQKELNLNVTFRIFTKILRRDFGSFYIMKDIKSHT